MISRGIKAVRDAAPEAVLLADANEGWPVDDVQRYIDACAEAGFSLVEQPLQADADEALRNVTRHVPLCADESAHDRSSLVRLAGLYDLVNIKLDKTGGLTEALAMAAEAQKRGFGIFVGCMLGSSLAMAPAMLLSPQARFVDLDGPLLLAEDRANAHALSRRAGSPARARALGLRFVCSHARGACQNTGAAGQGEGQHQKIGGGAPVAGTPSRSRPCLTP